MKLIIGGRAQGKLEFVLTRMGISEEKICDGAVCTLDQPIAAPVLNHLHLLIRRLLLQGIDPQTYILGLIKKNPEIVILTDEIGYGIVPTDPFEREWREKAGRVCCMLAERSETVERVVAGISQQIKGA